MKPRRVWRGRWICNCSLSELREQVMTKSREGFCLPPPPPEPLGRPPLCLTELCNGKREVAPFLSLAMLPLAPTNVRRTSLLSVG